MSVWHAIFPASGGGGDWRRDCLIPAAGVVHQHRQRGEGSWNVAWDARPARWTHRLDLAWLLFGVCAFLAPVDWNNFLLSHVKVPAPESEPPVAVVGKDEEEVVSCDDETSANYRVTGLCFLFNFSIKAVLDQIDSFGFDFCMIALNYDERKVLDFIAVSNCMESGIQACCFQM